jgi:hypothetical protein
VSPEINQPNLIEDCSKIRCASPLVVDTDESGLDNADDIIFERSVRMKSEARVEKSGTKSAAIVFKKKRKLNQHLDDTSSRHNRLWSSLNLVQRSLFVRYLGANYLSFFQLGMQ